MPMVAAFAAAVVTAAQAATAFVAGTVGGAVLAATGDEVLGLAVTSAVGSLASAAISIAPLAIASALLAPNVNKAGSPQDFRPDPNAPIPAVMGRYGVAGKQIYVTTSGGGNDPSKTGAYGNKHLTNIVVLSGLGPIQNYESIKCNDTIITFGENGNPEQCNGGYIPQIYVSPYGTPYKTNADGSYDNAQYRDRMTLKTQLGLIPSPAFTQPAIVASDSPVPEWGDNHALSSFAAAWWDCEFDVNAYSGGVPQPTHTISGYKTYDPRKDSTYPGGAGSHRWADRTTWEWSENPYIHALNYALGHWYADPNHAGQLKLYAGIGAPWSGVNVAAYVTGANVADANGWTICGQWTTGDGKWSVHSAMLQAGGGEPVIDRGMISCTVATPLTSLGTITAEDLAGTVQVDTTASLRERINAAYVGYSSEIHRWKVVQVVSPILAETYIAEDGGVVRATRINYQYISAVNQACQIAAYGIVNNREGITAVIPGKPKLRNYKVGDAVTVTIDEAGLTAQKMVVRKRSTDISTGMVTLTCRSETDAKHAYALGQSGVAPPTPSISGVDQSIVLAPVPASWATGVIVLTDTVSGQIQSVVRTTGSASDNPYATGVVLRYRLVDPVTHAVLGSGAWSSVSYPASQSQYDVAGLAPGCYDFQISYTTITGSGAADDTGWTDLGFQTVSATTAGNTANVGSQSAASVNTGLASLASQAAAQATSLASLVTTYGDTASAAASAAAASASQSAASTAETNAQTAASNAAAAQSATAAALASATTQAGNASTSAAGAASSESAAQAAAATATTQATDASGSATTAANAASTAQTAATNAATANSNAQSALTSAQGAATTATNQATAASGSASAAAGSATTATNQASAAAGSASAAAGAATTATTQAGNASTSAGQAASSASTAQSAATTATTQASNAAGSASAAATSATNAATSATSAGNSASSASSSATTATTQAGNAQTYASQASTSASNAAGSANTATTQAGVAATQAGNAAGSASAAAGSASTAATSASSAANSASAAQSASVSATASAAALLPSGMGLPSAWSPAQTFPNTGYAADDPHFITSSDGTQVFRTDQSASVLNVLVSVGTITPVIGCTYQATVTGRFVITPNSGPGSRLYVDIIGLRADGSVVTLAGGGVDNYGATAGPIITTTVTFAYTGSTPYSAIKVRCLPNLSNNSNAPLTLATYDILSISLIDITQSQAAGSSASAAATSASNAAASQSAAASSASAASSSATNASTYAGQASTYASQASTSASNAAGSANSASTQATNSANSATAAAGSASSASGSSSTAATQATNAANSATSAQGYANTASSQAANAANSASAASTSASSAATSASNAAASASSAATQATNASTSAGQAATYASQASSSATSAAGSANTASTQATNSANSAGAAAGSASAASGSASTAATQAGAAANSATSAQGYANTASSQAANALNSANAASTSASGAATSASNAANSASAASSASVSATATAAALLPSTFAQAFQFWTESWTTFNVTGGITDSAVSLVSVAGYGNCIQSAGAVRAFGAIGYLTFQATHSYNLTLVQNIVADSTNNPGGSQNQYFGLGCFDINGNFLGAYWLAAPPQTASQGWQTYSVTVTTEQIKAAYPGTVYGRPVFYQNYITAPGAMVTERPRLPRSPA